METFKRILAGFVIGISALGVILCVAGIAGVWLVNTPLTDRLTGTLDQVEVVLELTQARLDRAIENLDSVQELISSLKLAVTEAGARLAENNPVLTLLSDSFGLEVVPKIETAAEAVASVRETITSINSTLEMVNTLPLVSVPTLPMEQLTAVDQQMQEIVAGVKSLGENVQNLKAGVIEDVIIMITDPLTRIENLILEVRPPALSFRATLAEVEAAVTATNDRIPAMIDWASILLTLILAWFILAQGSLLYVGLYYLKFDTIPSVQIKSSQNISQDQ